MVCNFAHDVLSVYKTGSCGPLQYEIQSAAAGGRYPFIKFKKNMTEARLKLCASIEEVFQPKPNGPKLLRFLNGFLRFQSANAAGERKFGGLSA